MLGGTTYVATALEAPGLIVQTGVHRSIIFGEVFGDRSRISARVQQLADVLTAADIQVTPVADGRVPIWDKFVYLVAFSGFTGAARLPIGQLWKSPQAQEMFYATSREVAAIAKAEGVTISADRFDTLKEYMDNIPADDPVVAADRSRTRQAHRGRSAARRRDPARQGEGSADADHLRALRRPQAVGVRRPTAAVNNVDHGRATETQSRGALCRDDTFTPSKLHEHGRPKHGQIEKSTQRTLATETRRRGTPILGAHHKTLDPIAEYRAVEIQ